MFNIGSPETENALNNLVVVSVKLAVRVMEYEKQDFIRAGYQDTEFYNFEPLAKALTEWDGTSEKVEKLMTDYDAMAKRWAAYKRWIGVIE